MFIILIIIHDSNETHINTDIKYVLISDTKYLFYDKILSWLFPPQNTNKYINAIMPVISEIANSPDWVSTVFPINMTLNMTLLENGECEKKLLLFWFLDPEQNLNLIA